VSPRATHQTIELHGTLSSQSTFLSGSRPLALSANSLAPLSHRNGQKANSPQLAAKEMKEVLKMFNRSSQTEHWMPSKHSTMRAVADHIFKSTNLQLGQISPEWYSRLIGVK
jgi:hypothetical protein